MNINKYTEKAQEAILAAQQLADREGHPEITPEHVLLTLVEQPGGIVPEILRKMNIDPATVASAVRAELGRNPSAHGGSQPGLSARLRQVTLFQSSLQFTCRAPVDLYGSVRVCVDRIAPK